MIEVLCSGILGAGMFAVLVSMFSLTYGTGNAFSGNLGSGLSLVWNAVCDKLGSTDFIILGKVAVSETAGADPASGYGLFLTLVLAVMILISFFVIKSRLRPLLLLFAIPVVVLMILDIVPGVVAGALFGAGMVAALMAMNMKGAVRPSALLVPLIAVGVASLITAAISYTVSFDEPAALSSVGMNVKEAAHEMRYGKDALPKGRLSGFTGEGLKKSRGSIDDVKKALAEKGGGSGEDAALTVEMDRPGSYYLRGFVGTELAGNEWEPLGDDIFYDMRDKVYWLNRQGFDGLTEMALANSLSGAKEEVNNVSVMVKNASREYAFAPYELTSSDEWSDGSGLTGDTLPEVKIPGSYKNFGGSHLGNKGLTGKTSYEYQTSPNITGEWTDAVGRFYTAKKDPKIDSFFVSESNYNVMQYDSYCDISEDLVQAIRKEIGLPGDISRNHADYKTAITAIKNYLDGSYIYSETFKAPGKKEDAVKKFIKEKRGSDVQFATLATMMFRYYGIPARYVEGYLISEKNVEGLSEGGAAVNVPKEANHAWTEIYIDGFGWVPVEVTAEYSGIMKEADMNKGLKNVDYESKQKKRDTKQEQEEEDEEEEEKDDIRELIMRIVIIALIVLASLVLLVLMFFLIRMLVRWAKWRLAFRDKDPRKGVRALYQFGVEKKLVFSEAGEEIGNRASYSKGDVTEDDRTNMRKELVSAKERAKAEKNGGKNAGSNKKQGK